MKDDDVREKVEAMHVELGTWVAVARQLGVSRQYLYWYLKGGNTGRKILEAMGLEIRYVKAK